jgi:uncharacterized protein
VLAGVGGQYGLFVATYAIAGVYLSQPHTQVVVIGHGELADRLYDEAVRPFSVNKAALKFDFNHAVPQNLPPALAQTIPHLPTVKEQQTAAVLCSGISCQAPIFLPEELRQAVGRSLAAAQK